MKIRTAIFGTYVIASAVGLAVLMRFVLAEVRPRYVASLQGTLQQSAELMAASLAAQPRDQWPAVFDRIAKVGSGIDFQVMEAGVVLIDTNPTPAPEDVYPNGLAKQMMSRAVDSSEVPFGGMLAVYAPIKVEEGAPSAELRLSRPLSSVNAFIWSERKKLVLGTGLLAAVMLGLGWWLANRLAGSLQRLAAYAKAVQDGRNVRLPSTRAEEIAEVGAAFEGMRQALEGKQYVERYTQSLSHELKAPLTAIRGAAELLQEPKMNPESRAQFLGHLRTESERIQGIVDRMLELSSLEARGVVEFTDTVELHEVGAEALESLRAIAASKQISLKSLEEEVPVAVVGDRFLLLQALINLLRNAVDFSPVGGVVELSVRVKNETVELEVRDEGPGVPDYAQDKVFDRFYSLPRPAGGRKSTGLGLSFVHEIVTRHQGEVGLENRAVGGGTRAWIRLPRCAR